jgi:hypothetical protein
MDFGDALRACRAGSKITRPNLAARGIYVVYQPGYPGGIAINANTATATGLPEGTVLAFKPYLMIRCDDGQFMPWTPLSWDLLAQDWEIAA